jgi:1-acyl-sn-glycerol-3-phosphate acyltransferase
MHANDRNNAAMTKAVFRGVREYFWFYLAFLYFGAAGLAWSVIGNILYVTLPRRSRARFGKRMIHHAFRSFLWLLEATGLAKLDLSALDALRDEPGLIIAPNHPCLLDAVFVIAHVPEVACIMKAEIRDNILLGAGARLAGYIRNDSAMSMVRGAVREVRSGLPLLVFPEGTRTRRCPVNDFTGGFALIAKQVGAPIQTVFIETNSAFLGKGWPLLEKPTLPLVYRARLGKRLTVTGDVKAFVAELEGYYRDELANATVVDAGPLLSVDRSPRPGTAA